MSHEDSSSEEAEDDGQVPDDLPAQCDVISQSRTASVIVGLALKKGALLPASEPSQLGGVPARHLVAKPPKQRKGSLEVLIFQKQHAHNGLVPAMEPADGCEGREAGTRDQDGTAEALQLPQQHTHPTDEEARSDWGPRSECHDEEQQALQDGAAPRERASQLSDERASMDSAEALPAHAQELAHVYGTEQMRLTCRVGAAQKRVVFYLVNDTPAHRPRRFWRRSILKAAHSPLRPHDASLEEGPTTFGGPSPPVRRYEPCGGQAARPALRRDSLVDRSCAARAAVVAAQEASGFAHLELLERGSLMVKYSARGKRDFIWASVQTDFTLVWFKVAKKRLSRKQRLRFETGEPRMGVRPQMDPDDPEAVPETTAGMRRIAKGKLNAFPILNITGMMYGPFLANFAPFLNRANNAPGSSWLCMILEFPKRTICLVHETPELLTAWFQGLQELAPRNNFYLSRGRILWQRLIMKFNMWGIESVANFMSTIPLPER